MLKLRKNKKGFTLVELIVVIAIMAILAGTVAGVTVSQLNKSANDTAKTEVNNLVKEAQGYIAGLSNDAGVIMTKAQMIQVITDFGTNEKGGKVTAVATEGNDADKFTKVAGKNEYQFKVEEVKDSPDATKVIGLKVTFGCLKKGKTSESITADFTYDI